MTELYQIYYAEEQRKEIYPWAIPYCNFNLTPFFENSVIERLVFVSKADKIAICSWKLRQKLRYNVGGTREITQDSLEKDFSVLSFTRNSANHKMLHNAEVWHPGFNKVLGKICDAIAVTKPGEVKCPINQNHFCARADIYRDYVLNYLTPAMEVMIQDTDIHKLCMVDSGYTKLQKKSTVSSEYLLNNIGLPYYPLAPFLLERLFSIYCHNKKIKVDYI